MLSALWNLPSFLVLSLFFGSIPLMIKILGGVNYYWDYTVSQFRDDTLQVYDFIVVGAGSAGAVVANRLSKNNKVLLLEAGGTPLFYNSIPMLANEMLNKPEVDWLYKTVPQKFSGKAFPNQQFPWARGKLLGGTSNLNYQVYMRGNPNCYNNWANISGDSTWKYENVLPFFKKSLNYNGQYSKNEKHYGHSAYGYLSVESRKWQIPIHKHFMEGVKELGYPEVDVNGPQKIGFGPIEVTQKNGERFGTYTAFIKNFLHRTNLVVSRYSQATKIKLDKSGKTVGVWYYQHGVKKFARVSKEVIVSGGAIGSPQLLMLSGIGPKEHLASVGIRPKIDLPVGQNLQDHPVIWLTPISIEKPLSFLPERDLGIKSLTDYFFKGYGPFTVPLGQSSVGYIATSYASKDWPDLQIYMHGAGISQDIEWDLARFGYDESILRKYFAPAKSQGARDGIILFPVLNRPKSVGQLTLKDKNPFSQPLMDPRYLEHPQDVQSMIEGIKFCIKLVDETKSFQSVGAKYWDTPFPGCEQHPLRSDAYFECFLRHFGMHVWHPAGTCRMGRGPSDEKAVVDSKLRVLKTKGLRVADASIMPEIVNGNTNAPCIMIGEKVSDFIRQYWSDQHQVCDAWQRFLKLKEDQCFYSKIV